MTEIDLKIILEQVLLEESIRQSIIEITLKTKKAKATFDTNKKLNQKDAKNIKDNLNQFILKRLELRYELADLVKDKPILSGGRKIKTEKDLDEYIFNIDSDSIFHGIILLHSKTLPNPEKQFKGTI
jgi:hypothetical protein